MSKPIRNLKDLQAEKLILKQNRDKNFSESPLGTISNFLTTLKGNPVVSGAAMSLFKSKKKKPQRNQFLMEGVKTVLTLTTSVVVSRFKLGTFPKFLLTTGVAIATPYLVDKIQEKLLK